MPTNPNTTKTQELNRCECSVGQCRLPQNTNALPTKRGFSPREPKTFGREKPFCAWRSSGSYWLPTEQARKRSKLIDGVLLKQKYPVPEGGVGLAQFVNSLTDQRVIVAYRGIPEAR